MKKKLQYIACGSFLIISVIGLLIFIFSGESLIGADQLDIEGTWKVITYVNNSSVKLSEKDYILFSDNFVDVYRDGKEQPYESSNYRIDNSKYMVLPQISKKYTIDFRSENHMRLYESAHTYMNLIRCPNKDASDAEIDVSSVIGRWDVVYRDSEQNYLGQYLIFEDSRMDYYQADSESPMQSVEYYWEGSQIVLHSINKRMALHIISDDQIIFVETDTGYIWELKKNNV